MAGKVCTWEWDPALESVPAGGGEKAAVWTGEGKERQGPAEQVGGVRGWKKIYFLEALDFISFLRPIK